VLKGKRKVEKTGLKLIVILALRMGLTWQKFQITAEE
jgi:hypothetical protein